VPESPLGFEPLWGCGTGLGSRPPGETLKVYPQPWEGTAGNDAVREGEGEGEGEGGRGRGKGKGKGKGKGEGSGKGNGAVECLFDQTQHNRSVSLLARNGGASPGAPRGAPRSTPQVLQGTLQPQPPYRGPVQGAVPVAGAAHRPERPCCSDQGALRGPRRAASGRVRVSRCRRRTEHHEQPGHCPAAGSRGGPGKRQGSVPPAYWFQARGLQPGTRRASGAVYQGCTDPAQGVQTGDQESVSRRCTKGIPRIQPRGFQPGGGWGGDRGLYPRYLGTAGAELERSPGACVLDMDGASSVLGIEGPSQGSCAPAGETEGLLASLGGQCRGACAVS